MTQILFKDINKKNLHTMKVYEGLGGYKSLKKAFSQKPEEIVEAVRHPVYGVAVEPGFLLD